MLGFLIPSLAIYFLMGLSPAPRILTMMGLRSSSEHVGASPTLDGVLVCILVDGLPWAH